MKPLMKFENSGNKEDITLGTKLIAEGKVGTLILAGGIGSRLGFDGPKGTFLLPTLKKSLFQIHFEKIKPGLPVVVMTSGPNHEKTVEYLHHHNFYPEVITQKAPTGNGEALSLFYHSGLWKKWKEKGVEQLTTILVDNPLADPFDPNLCGFHKRKNDEVTLKCIPKLDPEEKVGAVVEINHRIKVIEYSELSSSQKIDCTVANISLFSFSFEFIEKIANVELPWHSSKKQEKYIFDLLDYAEKTSVLLYPRNEVFCPLKSPEDIAKVEQALMNDE